MYTIKQITPMDLFTNQANLEFYLSEQLTPLITEKSWLTTWEEIALRFKLLKFKEMDQEDVSSFEWDTRKVEEIIEETICEVQKVLPFDHIKMTVVPAMPFRWFQKYDRGLWTNGFTNGPNCVQLAVPPHPDEDFLKHMVAHELHHATPINPIYDLKDFTLGEWLKMEGTAEFFSLTPNKDKRWWKEDFNDDVKRLYWNLVKDKVYSTDDEEMNLLCFGNPDKGIPYLAGYAFAYELVKNYVNQHPITDIKDLFYGDIGEFINAYK